jgi:biopolymer transport protein ExbD
MKLVYTGNLLAILVFVLFLVIFGAMYASGEASYRKTIFLVKIPPPVSAGASEKEKFWRFQKFLFPQENIPTQIPEAMPNFCGLFVISLEKNGSIKINRETYARLSDAAPLIEKLREIFRYREDAGVIDEITHRPIKAVMLKAPRSAKYGDIIKVVDALKQSGADPIVLQIDDLPE